MTTSVRSDFAHGEYPLAADLNDFSDAISEIYAIEPVSINMAVPKDVSEAIFSFIHTQRYLWFKSTGAIVDPSGVGDDVSISESGGVETRYDLDSISWMSYGMFYQVTGVSFCEEMSA